MACTVTKFAPPKKNNKPYIEVMLSLSTIYVVMANYVAECKISSVCMVQHYRACVVGNCVVNIAVLCLQSILILSASYTYLSPLFVWSVMMVECCRCIYAKNLMAYCCGMQYNIIKQFIVMM